MIAKDVNDKIILINIKVVLLSSVFNIGAIVAGVALYSLQLSATPFSFISEHSHTNYIMLFVGVVLLLVNLYLVLKLGKKKKVLESQKKSMGSNLALYGYTINGVKSSFIWLSPLMC